MRLPDGAQSRAVLLGSSRFEHLDDLPAVANNLEAVRSSLVQCTGLPEWNCTTLLDAPNVEAVGGAVHHAATSAGDLLLVYYAGHGLVRDNELHLALPRTNPDLAAWSSVPIRTLAKTVRDSPADNRVLVLDCCFSGRAVNALGSARDIIYAQIQIKGTYTLASSPDNEVSFARPEQTYTEFTGGLIDILWNGYQGAGEYLTLEDLYRALLRRAWEHHLPEPQQRTTHTTSQLALGRNAAVAPPPTTPPVLEPQPVPANSGYYTWSPDVESPPVPAGHQYAAAPHPAAPPTTGHPTYSFDATLAEIADTATVRPDDVRDVQFSNAGLSAEGYVEEEVDAFLDRLVVALEPDLAALRLMRSSDVDEQTFTVKRKFWAYDMGEVDDFLDRVSYELSRRWQLAELRLGPDWPTLVE